MITISTTSEAEAAAMTVLMMQAAPGTGYQVYLLGRQVAACTGRLPLAGPPSSRAAEPDDRQDAMHDDAPALMAAPVPGPGGVAAPDAGASPRAAAYDVMFPVRARVARVFARKEIELAARIAFWQHPPDDCSVPAQALALTWMDNLLVPGAQLIRVSGGVIPPAVAQHPSDDGVPLADDGKDGVPLADDGQPDAVTAGQGRLRRRAAS